MWHEGFFWSKFLNRYCTSYRYKGLYTTMWLRSWQADIHENYVNDKPITFSKAKVKSKAAPVQWRHRRGVEAWLQLFLTSTLEVSGQSHAKAASPPEDEPQASIEQEIVWAPEQTRAFLKTEKHLAPARIFFSCLLLLFSRCTFSVLVFLFWLSCLVPLSLPYNKQHKHPCPRRDPNP